MGGDRDNDDDFDALYAQRERDETNEPAETIAEPPAAKTDRRYEATYVSDENSRSKQEIDLAFAAIVLESGSLSERQISKAVSEWTIHGEKRLSDHLLDAGLLSASLKQKFEQLAADRIEKTVIHDSSNAATSSPDLAHTLLEDLDSSGRLTRLLGLTSMPTAQLDQDARRLKAQYEVLRKIGQGGLGTVWLARDVNLRRHVAIKEISQSGVGYDAAVNRFRREAKITGQLEHPSIVPVYQFGEDLNTGKVFYAMRFLGKRTLQDAIVEYHERRETGDHDPMMLHHLLTAFVSVCQAIAYAHSRNIIHRDLKPENVALDSYGQVIVLDWGLSKMIGDSELLEGFSDTQLGTDSGSTNSSHQTVAGQVLGTPMYMAPEQAAGRTDDIDERTDVFGLGAILFAILTGYAPHEASHHSVSSKSNVTQLFTAIVSDPTPRALEMIPETPPELDAVCAKAMAKKRFARYATASELAEDVQRWVAGEPVSGYTEPWSKRLQRWVAAHQRLSQVLVVTATMLLVATITLGITSHYNRQSARQARFDSVRAEGRELAIRLNAGAVDLSQNVRFMSTLPPIQGLIDAINTKDAEQELVWKERLETIYRGLLQANTDYLAVTYTSIVDGAQEIVRVERNALDGSFVRVLPQSRLAQRELTGRLESLAQAKPGDVFIERGSLFSEDGDDVAPELIVLTAAVPIYDENSGTVFGVVSVESNFEKVLRDLLNSTAKAAADVYVTDRNGRITLDFSRENGFQDATLGRPVASVVDGIGDFFAQHGNGDTTSETMDFFAIKLRRDRRRPNSGVGLVLTLDD